MSIQWITFGAHAHAHAHALAVGADATFVNRFFENVLALEAEGGARTILLKRLSEGDVPGFDALSDVMRAGIQSLASFLLNRGDGDKLNAMRQPIGDVLGENTLPVLLDFPLHRFSLGPLNISGLPVGLSLSSESKIAYMLGLKDEHQPSPATALTELSLDGDIAFNANLSVPVGTVAGLSSAASVSARRKLSYALRCDRRLQTWQGVADAMSRVVPIDDYGSVLESFRTAPPLLLDAATPQIATVLNEVKMEGLDSLLVEAGATLRIPLADAGTLTGRASGEIKMGGGFTVRITQAESSQTPGRPVLVVTAEKTDSSRRSTELGIGYSFGVSHLSPEAAKSLLNALVDAADILDKIDHVLDSAETFLKPGSLLKNTLRREIAERIAGEGAAAQQLRIVFGDVVGFDAEGQATTIADQAATLLATLLDNNEYLFEGDFGRAVALVFEPFTSKLRDSAKDKITEIVDIASQELKQKVDAAANELDGATDAKLMQLLGFSPTDRIAAVRGFLGKSRSLLTEVTNRVADRNLDLVAAEIAWSYSAEQKNTFRFGAEISEDAHEYYKSAIWRPSFGANRLLNAAQEPILGVHPLAAERTELANRLSNWTSNVGIVDALVSSSSSNTSFSEIKVETTLSGVSVGSSAWNETRSDLRFLFRKGPGRSIRLSDALTFVTVEGPDGTSIETGHLALAYVWDEQGSDGLSPAEINKFCNTFKKVALLSESGAIALAALLSEAKPPGGGNPQVEVRAQLVIPPDYGAKVIRYIAETKWWAREVVKDVVGNQEILGEPFGLERIDALIEYFSVLDEIRDMLMMLPANTDQTKRAQLREAAINKNAVAQDKLVEHNWLATTFLLGVLWDPPQPGPLALFRCLAELCAQTPGCGRPGMVYTFAVQGEEPRFVICPRAGDVEHWDNVAAQSRAPRNVMMRRHGLLLRGHVKPEVAVLQRYLLQHGLRVPLNRKFDQQTDDAVRQFQAEHGLGVDGKVGPATWSALAPTA